MMFGKPLQPEFSPLQVCMLQNHTKPTLQHPWPVNVDHPIGLHAFAIWCQMIVPYLCTYFSDAQGEIGTHRVIQASFHEWRQGVQNGFLHRRGIKVDSKSNALAANLWFFCKQACANKVSTAPASNVVLLQINSLRLFWCKMTWVSKVIAI